MELMPASVDEIATFKLAAVETYKKAGIDPKTAAALFEKTMSKLAGELGLSTEKQAIDVATVASVADDVATLIANKMGRKRASADKGIAGKFAAKIAEVISHKHAQAATSTPMSAVNAPAYAMPKQLTPKQNVMGGTGSVAPSAPKAPSAAMPKAAGNQK
jgi:hypothetical protein